MGAVIEEIVLKYSNRGMDVLSEYLPKNQIEIVAKKIYELPRGNIFITTGFYVAGFAETDGPPGTLALALALKDMGFTPIIVTDKLCKDYFEAYGITVEYAAVEAGEWLYTVLMEDYKPVAVISNERCGENINGDYANMRGISIANETAKVDYLFAIAKKKGIVTLGIGDGGNEIGMGNLKKEIEEKLSLVPCKTEVDYLMVATVSNWGAYGLVAYLSLLEGKNLLLTYEEIYKYLEYIISKGAVDGVKKENVPTVDGYSKETSKEIVDALHEVITTSI